MYQLGLLLKKVAYRHSCVIKKGRVGVVYGLWMWDPKELFFDLSKTASLFMIVSGVQGVIGSNPLTGVI